MKAFSKMEVEIQGVEALTSFGKVGGDEDARGTAMNLEGGVFIQPHQRRCLIESRVK